MTKTSLERFFSSYTYAVPSLRETGRKELEAEAHGGVCLLEVSHVATFFNTSKVLPSSELDSPPSISSQENAPQATSSKASLQLRFLLYEYPMSLPQSVTVKH